MIPSLDEGAALSIADESDTPEVAVLKMDRSAQLRLCLKQCRRNTAKSSTSSTTTKNYEALTIQGVSSAQPANPRQVVRKERGCFSRCVANGGNTDGHGGMPLAR